MSNRMTSALRYIGVMFVAEREVSRIGSLAHTAVIGNFRELENEELPEIVTLLCGAVVPRAELEIVTLHEDSTVHNLCALGLPEEHREILPLIYQNPGFMQHLKAAGAVDRDRHGERVIFQRCDGGNSGY